MRISDWISDVCSSALRDSRRLRFGMDRLGPVAPYRSADDVDRGLQLRRVDRDAAIDAQMGSASCRERVCQHVSLSVVAVSLQKRQYSNAMIHGASNIYCALNCQ